LQIEAVPVDVADVVAAAVATMQPAALDRHVRTELDVAPGTYGTIGDRRRLEQLVRNLLSNAIKFSSPNAAVAVTLSRKGAAIELRVEDSGVGIAPELLPHVFDAFRQGDSSWARQHGGFGIGLTMARYFAERHGGTLDASSAGPGLGAELVLTLPLVEGAGPATPSATAPARAVGARPLAELRILVVDDDPDVRELVTMLLSDAGASVEAAASAKEAIALYERATFDLLLSDLGMPGEDGLWLVRQIRRLDSARGGSLKAVAISGYGSIDDRQRSVAAGFDAHWTKGLDIGNLIDSVVRLVHPRKAED